MRRSALLQLPEPLHEVLSHPLAANLCTFDESCDRAQHLARVDRFDEIIVHLNPDRLPHRPRFFALRDHDDRHGRVDRPNFGNQLQATLSGKLLIEQNHAVGSAPQQRDRIIPMGRTLHFIPLLFEKEHVCGERFHLVINPENCLRTCHEEKRTRNAPPTPTLPVAPPRAHP